MKKTLIALAALMISVAAYGQGQVNFSNRVTGQTPASNNVDAPVRRQDGTGAGAGITAQLFVVGAGGTLTPFTPTTTFRTSTAAAAFYNNPTAATVTGFNPGDVVTVRMRAWEGASFDSTTVRGESNDITVTLGGGVLTPPNLVGLQGFTLVPEPTTIAFGVLGAAALLLRRRK